MNRLGILAFAFVALSHGAWAACPTYTLSLPYQVGAVAASAGTVTDSAGNVWNYNTPATPSSAQVAVAVTLTPASCAPPPPTTAFVTGETTLGPLRNDYASPVGFYILVGSAPITVTDLGRWVVAGNSRQHAVSIYDSTCKSLGSVTVNTSGAPSGAFIYASLSSPVVLAAGQHYYVMSTEAVGGDQWYDYETVLTTTTAATVMNIAYIDATGACNAGASSGHSYGFPSFKYH